MNTLTIMKEKIKVFDPLQRAYCGIYFNLKPKTFILLLIDRIACKYMLEERIRSVKNREREEREILLGRMKQVRKDFRVIWRNNTLAYSIPLPSSFRRRSKSYQKTLKPRGIGNRRGEESGGES